MKITQGKNNIGEVIMECRKIKMKNRVYCNLHGVEMIALLTHMFDENTGAPVSKYFCTRPGHGIQGSVDEICGTPEGMYRDHSYEVVSSNGFFHTTVISVCERCGHENKDVEDNTCGGYLL